MHSNFVIGQYLQLIFTEFMVLTQHQGLRIILYHRGGCNIVGKFYGVIEIISLREFIKISFSIISIIHRKHFFVKIRIVKP